LKIRPAQDSDAQLEDGADISRAIAESQNFFRPVILLEGQDKLFGFVYIHIMSYSGAYDAHRRFFSVVFGWIAATNTR
jgi:hypothetical protein